MISLIKNNLDKIKALCRQYQVQSLYLIGSAAGKGKKFSKESDIDFLLKYKRNKEGLAVNGFDYFDLLFALEDLTGKKVDLVVEESINNYVFRESIERNKMKIYEA
jgi:predicted nucleotidyltransferase